MIYDVHETAENLLRHLTADADDKEDHYWAWECVETMIDAGDSLGAWSVISMAIRLASTDRELKFLGAGVLESLLSSRGGEVLDVITKEARHNPKVVTALKSAHLPDADEEILHRIAVLTGRGGGASS